MDKRKKLSKEAVIEYLKSRKNAFFRMVFFALLAALFYGIGKVWKESFYVTLRFLYPISFGIALFQLFYFLPRWDFLKPRFKKMLEKVGGRVLAVFDRLGEAMRKLGEGIRRRSNKNTTKKVKKGRKSKNGAYRDEFLYAEGKGLFGSRRRHLRWRDMKTNQDKVRFYYMRYVLGTVKKGAPFGYHLTPGELKALWKNPEGAEPLTGLYYRARYGEEEIGEEEVFKLGAEKQAN